MLVSSHQVLFYYLSFFINILVIAWEILLWFDTCATNNFLSEKKARNKLNFVFTYLMFDDFGSVDVSNQIHPSNSERQYCYIYHW